MSAMDAGGGKLIFIFTHIMTEFLAQLETASGRKVHQLPLPHLEIYVWKNIPDLSEAARHPALHQLFLSCSGHPRSIFDGIKNARKQNPSLLTDPTPDAISLARETIIQSSKFQLLSFQMLDIILKWFSLIPLTEKELIQWRYSGLLHTMKDTKITFLFPLLVQHWSRENCTTYSIAYHIQQLYAADASLDKDAEKRMESVMYHYEAVVRIAQSEKAFTFGLFYNTRFCDQNLHDMYVTAKLPLLTGGESLVHYVSNFQDDPQSILLALNNGRIVVSEKHSEIGIENLVPFRKSLNNTLIVAFVQCKFVQSSANWSEISIKMKKSMDNLKSKIEFQNVQMFAVVYTTTDQNLMQKSTYSGGVYYTEYDLFNFTNKLGILRMHTQKLGERLQEQYPVLKRARSELL